METRDCDRCGKPIPEVRLLVLPETTRCIRCSAERARTVYDVELDGPEARDLQASVTGVER